MANTAMIKTGVVVVISAEKIIWNSLSIEYLMYQPNGKKCPFEYVRFAVHG